MSFCGIGLFGGGSCMACLFEQLCVMEGDADSGGDGRQQTLIGFVEASFLVDATGR